MCQRCEKLDHHQIQCVKIMSKNDIFKIVPTLSGQKWRVFKSNLDALTVLSVLDTGL